MNEHDYPRGKKVRKPFMVIYQNGSYRNGWLYHEGNIMMSDGELFARLDQLVDERVLNIRFKADR